MKKLLLILLVATFMSLGVGSAYAQQPQGIDYAPLEPLPGLQNASNVNFAQFLGLIFNLLLIAGALLAVATLVYAGISYILSEAFETKGEARKRMVAAMYGLVILLGAWLLLNTINPALLKFDLSSIGTRGTGNSSGSSVNGSGGNNIGNAGGTSTIPHIVVSGGSGVMVFSSGPLKTTAKQMQAEADKCRSKGLTFKATSETDVDEEYGAYTVWRCQ